eukprot:162685-Pyramimonas_sp.AAC.1
MYQRQCVICVRLQYNTWSKTLPSFHRLHWILMPSGLLVGLLQAELGVEEFGVEEFGVEE